MAHRCGRQRIAHINTNVVTLAGFARRIAPAMPSPTNHDVKERAKNDFTTRQFAHHSTASILLFFPLKIHF